MKQIIRNLLKASLLAVVLTSVGAGYGQTIVATESQVTSMGVIHEYSPEGILLTTPTAAQPVKYRHSTDPVYVDELGNPVEVTSITTGVPVTIHYSGSADAYEATRVIVRKPEVKESPVIEKSTTTTTTTETP